MRAATVRVACGLGLAMVMILSLASSAHAGNTVVPEIDGGVLPAALGILSAGVLLLRARRRSK